MASDRVSPTWLVVVVLWDEDGDSDSWTEVLTAPGLNRRQAIAEGTKGLPGSPDDPLIQRMIAWNQEVSKSVLITSARVRVIAHDLTEADDD